MMTLWKFLATAFLATSTASAYGHEEPIAPSNVTNQPNAYQYRGHGDTKVLYLLAAAEKKESGETAEKTAGGDKMFVAKAAEGGMAEVALGKLANEKAGRDEVKKIC